MPFNIVQKIPFLVLAGLIAATPFVIRLTHRPEPPGPLTKPAMASALALARDAVYQGAGKRLPEAEARVGEIAPEQSPELAAEATGPVLVTVYGVGLTPRRAPPLGIWYPAPDDVGTTLRDAIHEAGLEAGRKLRGLRRGSGRMETARIKVDIGGAPRTPWLSFTSYLEQIIDPGRDGLMGVGQSRTACLPPSWLVERNWKLTRALKQLRGYLGGPEVPFELKLYRTQAFVEGIDEEPGPLPLFRGNVLISELTSQTVHRSLKLGGEYLARMIGPNGKYCYTYFPHTDRCDQAYNLLRHAGTTYSLYQLYAVHPDPDILTAVERAAQWLREQVRPVAGDPTRVYMLEGNKAKLGAIGLGLLALVEREKVLRDGHDRELLNKMGNFVVSQQREDGYLESWYQWKQDVKVPARKSIYYPGEALLGLVRLHDIDPQDRWLEAAVKSARFLAIDRWKWGGIELYVPPDAWLTQALAELHPKSSDEALKDYVYELVEVTEVTMLDAAEGAAPDLAGGPAFGLVLPAVTPAGSRNEGLTAAYRMAVAAGDSHEAERIKDLSYQSARFQIGQQYRPANTHYLPNPARAMGGFRARPDKLDVRIDYVQHNATGLIGVMNMLEEDGR